MAEQVKTLAFTGHRPPKIGGYKVPNQTNEWVYEQLYTVINHAINNGFTHFISGGAMGVDLLAATTVIKIRQDLHPNITLEIAKPFPSQSSKWYPDTVKAFDMICSVADAVICVSPDPYSPQKMQLRNEYMVKNCDALIAVWDGTKGGTFNCIAYADRINVRVYHINPLTRIVEGWLK